MQSLELLSKVSLTLDSSDSWNFSSNFPTLECFLTESTLFSEFSDEDSQDTEKKETNNKQITERKITQNRIQCC